MITRCMVKDLLVRGFDDETHSQLGDMAGQMGVSLNSIVKDAVDKWIENNSQTVKKHELILYTDDESLKNFLKSLDRILQSDGFFNACCGPKDHHGMQFLTKRGWFDGTVEPYKGFLDNPNNYGKKVIQKIGNHINSKQLMIIAFLTGDLAKNKTVPKSVDFCQWYHKQNVPGITHCVTHAENILSGSLANALELFEAHDQVFIVKKDSINKIHVTKESIHKLLLN